LRSGIHFPETSGSTIGDAGQGEIPIAPAAFPHERRFLSRAAAVREKAYVAASVSGGICRREWPQPRVEVVTLRVLSKSWRRDSLWHTGCYFI
jgi:hypothetical protein